MYSSLNRLTGIRPPERQLTQRISTPKATVALGDAGDAGEHISEPGLRVAPRTPLLIYVASWHGRSDDKRAGIDVSVRAVAPSMATCC